MIGSLIKKGFKKYAAELIPFGGTALDVGTALYGMTKKSENVVRPAVKAERNALGVLRNMDTTVDVRDQMEEADAAYRSLASTGGLGRNSLLGGYAARMRTGNTIMGDKARAEASMRAARDQALADATARYDLADMESEMAYRNDLEGRDAALGNIARQGVQRAGEMFAARRQAELTNEVGLATALGTATSDSARRSIMSILGSSRNLSPAMQDTLQRLSSTFKTRKAGKPEAEGANG